MYSDRELHAQCSPLWILRVRSTVSISRLNYCFVPDFVCAASALSQYLFFYHFILMPYTPINLLRFLYGIFQLIVILGECLISVHCMTGLQSLAYIGFLTIVVDQWRRKPPGG
jgi:hypothetical protein